MTSIPFSLTFTRTNDAATGSDQPRQNESQMTDDTWQDAGKRPSDGEVAFDYIKAQDFKTFWADGVIGGLTPRGHIHFALYIERPALPRRQVFEILNISDESGTIGKEVMEKRISRGSIVREMACDVFLGVDEAENLARWLMDRVQEFRAIAK